MANLQTDVPLINVPMTNKDGRITEPWLLFLVQMWRRTGGSDGGNVVTQDEFDALARLVDDQGLEIGGKTVPPVDPGDILGKLGAWDMNVPLPARRAVEQDGPVVAPPRPIDGIPWDGTVAVPQKPTKIEYPADWTPYNPTVTAASGTFTNVTATGAYYRIGDLVLLQIAVNVVDAGTGITPIVSLPFAASGLVGPIVMAGRELAITGYALTGTIGAGDSNIVLAKFDNSSPTDNGSICVITGSYVT